MIKPINDANPELALREMRWVGWLMPVKMRGRRSYAKDIQSGGR